jgi:hypothetical protein
MPLLTVFLQAEICLQKRTQKAFHAVAASFVGKAD